MANALSQIKLNESQANKNEAEANKIKGVDTEAQQATIDNLIAKTSNEKNKARAHIRTNQSSRRRRRAQKKYRRLDKGKSRGNTMER